MSKSRLTIAVCVSLIYAPAAAHTLTACDFISQQDVEKVLGANVSLPKVTDKNVCAGLCASLNSSLCGFETIGTPAPKELYLEVSLPHFEFDGRQERRIMEAGARRDEVIQSVRGFGSDAFWYYRSDIQQSLFFTYRRGRIRFMVQEIGLDAGSALTGATMITKAAFEKWNSLSSHDLKNAFQFHMADESHPKKE